MSLEVLSNKHRQWLLDTLLIVVAILISIVSVHGQEKRVEPAAASTMFQAIDVFVDTGNEQLAAYQLEFSSTSHDIRIVGVEGGEPAAFREPPFYDPKSLQQDRTILAAFSVNDELPGGRFRLARIHIEFDVNEDSDEPTYSTDLVVSANSDGQHINAKVTVAPAKGESR